MSDAYDYYQCNTKETNHIGYILYQNILNPLDEITIIKFALSQAGRVKLTISELNGQELIVLADRTFEAGISEVKFKANDYNLSNGIYIYTISVNGFRDTRRWYF